MGVLPAFTGIPAGQGSVVDIVKNESESRLGLGIISSEHFVKTCWSGAHILVDGQCFKIYSHDDDDKEKFWVTQRFDYKQHPCHIKPGMVSLELEVRSLITGQVKNTRLACFNGAVKGKTIAVIQINEPDRAWFDERLRQGVITIAGSFYRVHRTLGRDDSFEVVVTRGSPILLKQKNAIVIVEADMRTIRTPSRAPSRAPSKAHTPRERSPARGNQNGLPGSSRSGQAGSSGHRHG